MDGVLQSHISELMRGREEYRALFDKLTLANQVMEEREEKNQSLLSEKTRETENLRRIIQSHNALRESFDMDVKQIAKSATLLEDREREMNSQFNNIKSENVALKKDLDNVKTELDKAHRRMEDDMVSVDKYEDSKVSFDKQLKEVTLQKENALQKLDKKEEELQRSTIEFKVSLGSMVPLNEYNSLEQKVRILIQDNEIVEQSVKIVEESRNAAIQSLKDADKRILQLQETNQESEIKTTNSKITQERLQVDIDQLREELDLVDQERRNSVERACFMENSRASLLTQIGNLKLSSRKGTEEQWAILQKLKEAETTIGKKDRIIGEHTQKLNETLIQIETEKSLLRENCEKSSMEVDQFRAKFERERAEKKYIEEQLNRGKAELQEVHQAIMTDSLLASNQSNQQSNQLNISSIQHNHTPLSNYSSYQQDE